jgi:hypothetical protein
VRVRLSAAATAPAVKRAVEALGAARMVPSAYRWTGKPPPTAASPYVALALAPLRDLLAAPPLSRVLPPDARLEWSADAAAKVTEQCVAGGRRFIGWLTEHAPPRFADIVRETMAAARLGPKAPAKSAGGAAPGAAGASSDQSKMELQLSIDVTDFAAQLQLHLALPPAVTDPLLARLRAALGPV